MIRCTSFYHATQQALCVQGFQLLVLWQEGRPRVLRLRGMCWAASGNQGCTGSNVLGETQDGRAHTCASVFGYAGMGQLGPSVCDAPTQGGRLHNVRSKGAG